MLADVLVFAVQSLLIAGFAALPLVLVGSVLSLVLDLTQ